MASTTVATHSALMHTKISPPKRIADGDQNYYDRQTRLLSLKNANINTNNTKNGFHKKSPIIVKENRGLALLAALAISKKENLDSLSKSPIIVIKDAIDSTDRNSTIKEIDIKNAITTQAPDNVSKNNCSDKKISTKSGYSLNGKTTAINASASSATETPLKNVVESDTANVKSAAGTSTRKLTTKKSSSESSVLTVLSSSSKTTNSTTLKITTTKTIKRSTTIRKGFIIPSDILDDLASRFIINVPNIEELNLIRIIFQIELAHWFYLDFFCTAEMNKGKQLQPVGIKSFTMQLFEHIPFLNQHLSSLDDILGEWKKYKQSVPTYGAIIVADDLEHCLLVQSYISKSSWGFPKGKINEHEDPVHCAAREVFEETGFDITKLIVPNDYIEAIINFQYIRLYIVRDIPIKTKFQPRTRNEIKCCDWFPIDSLPINKNDAISKTKLGLNSNSFFMILPFVKRLKKWVSDKRAGIETVTSRRRKNSGGSKRADAVTSPLNAKDLDKKTSQSKRQRHKSMGDLDGIKLNNINHNTKTTVNDNSDANLNAIIPITPVAAPIKTITETATAPAVCKRQTKNSNNSNNNNGSIGTTISTSKRQLFIQNNGQINNTKHAEKISNTFDVIRKEKLIPQQLIQTVTSIEQPLQAQKQQNDDAAGKGVVAAAVQIDIGIHKRVRAKSQSDKVAMQTNKTYNNSNSNNNNGLIAKQRLQKQQSMIATTTSTNDMNATIEMPIKAKTPPPILQKTNEANKEDIVKKTTTPLTLPKQKQSYTSAELIAIVAASSAKHNQQQQQQQQLQTNIEQPTGKTIILKQILTKSSPNIVQKSLRPPTVTVHIDTTTARAETIDNMQKFKHLASSTNLKIVQTAAAAQQQTEQQPIKIPSFNSWTNFSFTKNFITNVFC